ncbi:MAG: histidinol-phosphate aminotransferase [Actinomycetota bacterium]|jgi:histidinol-phosphate aminotransferase|nr:histidinol-phosphate aminotransferase [Actinomycetota bacterium]
MIRTRQALDLMPEYVPGRSAESVAAKYAIGDVVKLASNEAPFPPLPAAVAAITEAAGRVNRYPDDATTALREELAEHYSVTPEQVLLGNGSVELCRMALAATCDPGDEVVFGWPSFEAYPILVQQVGATMVPVPLTACRYDLDGMADAITDRTRLVFVCNPNNPTGTIVDRDAVDRFLQRVPSDLLVVFDEAYREFVTAADFPDGLDELQHHDNVAVLRTFSKAYGLAALRVGYAIAQPDVIGALRKVRVPFEVNGLAQVAASASLAAQDEMRARVDEVVAERTRLFAAIADLGLEVVASEANFLWLPLGEYAAVLGEYSERAGVVLRPFPGVGVRITIGTPEENARLLRVLRAALEDGAAGR